MDLWSPIRDHLAHSSQRLAWRVFSLLHLRKSVSSGTSGDRYPQPEKVASAAPGESSLSEELASRGGDLSVVRHAEAGKVFAAYSFRFVAMPLAYFCDTMQQRISMPQERFVERLAQDEVYANQAIEDFFEIAAQAEGGSQGAEYLREEVFHHRHLRNTALWVFSQGFAMLLRFAFSYICLHRVKTQDRQRLPEESGYREVSRFMFDVYFGAAYLKGESFPVIEGYAHWRELAEKPERVAELRKAYKARATIAAREFVSLRDLLVGAYGSTQGETLLDQIAEDIINLPIAQGEFLNDFSFFSLRQKLWDDPLRFAPFPRLKFVRRQLEEMGLLEAPNECRQRVLFALDTADFEDQFSPGLLWYFTRTFVPGSLVSFVLSRLLVSKYGAQVLSHLIVNMIRQGGKQIERYTYSGLPALRMYTQNGGTIIYDPALEFFSPKDSSPSRKPFRRAQVAAIEFGLRGFTPQVLEFIQLQALLMNSIAAKFFNYSQEDHQAYREFMFRWIPALAEHRAEIEPWLCDLDRNCETLVAPLQEEAGAGRNPFSGTVFTNFLMEFEALFWRCWDSLSEEDARKKNLILWLGDGLYMHGLS